MAVPSTISDLSTTAASNSPQGSDSIGTTLDDYLRAIQAIQRTTFNDQRDSKTQWLTGVSGTDTITATAASPVPTAYQAGQTFRFVSAGANTTAVTLNISSLGAKSVTKNGSTALSAGDIPSGAVVAVTYDGTQFQLQSISGLSTGAAGLFDISGSTAGQIKFPAAQNPSSNANTLDDYEEGTWTATLKGSTTDPSVAVTASGSYTKVGNQVSVNVYFNNVATTGAAGNISVSGLPFASASGPTHTCSVASYLTATFTGTSLVGLITTASTSISVYSSATNAVWATATHNAGTGRFLSISATYFV